MPVGSVLLFKAYLILLKKGERTFFYRERVRGVFWGFEAGPLILQNFQRRDGKSFVRRDGRLDTDTAAYHPP